MRRRMRSERVLASLGGIGAYNSVAALGSKVVR
jgi:hypothetical protein